MQVCPEGLQQELVAFLPEVAMDNEHQLAIEALMGLVNDVRAPFYSV